MIRLDRFPHEISIAIDGLNNEHRQRILLILNSQDKLSFAELASKLDMGAPLLANHIRKMTESLLVEHFYEHTIGDERYSFYRISSFGKRLLASLLGSLYIKRRITFSFAGTAEIEESVTSGSFVDMNKRIQEIVKSTTGESESAIQVSIENT